MLIGGEPGIGKSTLVLQNILSIRGKRILYVSGEESAAQLKMRADRIGRLSDNCFIVCDTSLESIMRHVDSLKPEMLVVDSIQTIASDAIESSSGSVSQVRECAAQLLRYAKSSGTPVILIGHINKEGSIAGRSTLRPTGTELRTSPDVECAARYSSSVAEPHPVLRAPIAAQKSADKIGRAHV